jgi:hypothetical protein
MGKVHILQMKSALMSIEEREEMEDILYWERKPHQMLTWFGLITLHVTKASTLINTNPYLDEKGKYLVDEVYFY